MSEINKINSFIKDAEENDWDESEYKVLLKEAILIIKYFCNEAYLCPHCDNEVTLDDLENSKNENYEDEDEDEDEDDNEEVTLDNLEWGDYDDDGDNDGDDDGDDLA